MEFHAFAPLFPLLCATTHYISCIPYKISTMFHRFWSCAKLTLVSAVALLSAFPATATAQDAVFAVGEPLPRATSGM